MEQKICGAIRQSDTLQYPKVPPYDPGRSYPEFAGLPVSDGENMVYEGVRQCLHDLGMDREHQNTPEWDPFSEFIAPGNTVVIKPNLVINTSDPMSQDCTTTHPSLIRALVDYCWKALRGNGQIVVGDSPGDTADFSVLVQQTGYKEMIENLQNRGVNVSLVDFRATKTVSVNGITVGDQRTGQFAPEACIVNLGKDSRFAAPKYDNVKLAGGGYDIAETTNHHRGDTQEYSVSKIVMEADVVISVPKLKTHRRAGVTCCMKNLVGINTDKNYLPHFTLGSANTGGDEMPAIKQKYVWRLRLYNWLRVHVIGKHWRQIGMPAVRFLRILRGKSQKTDGHASASASMDLGNWIHQKITGQAVDGGGWQGNLTIPDMILDLNRIFLYCDQRGVLRTDPTRKVFYIVDGVIMGAGNGPLAPAPLHTGLIAAGWNAFMIDMSLLSLLNIDEDKIPLYKSAKECGWLLQNGGGEILFNAHPLKKDDALPVQVEEPPSWDYRKFRGTET